MTAPSKVYGLALRVLRRAVATKEKYGLGFLPVPTLRVLISPLDNKVYLMFRGDLYEVEGDITLDQLAEILPIRVFDELARPFGLPSSGRVRFQMMAGKYVKCSFATPERRFSRVIVVPGGLPPLLDWRSGYFDDRWMGTSARLDVTFGSEVKFVAMAPTGEHMEKKSLRLVSGDTDIQIEVPRGDLFMTPPLKLTEEHQTVLLEATPAEPYTNNGDLRVRGVLVQAVYVNGRPRRSCNFSDIPLLD